MGTFWFLHATRANYFMTEILAAVEAATRRAGAVTRTVSDRYPAADPQAIYVLIPHEFFQLAPDFGDPASGQLARTIGLCVEQPGTDEFEKTCRYGSQLGAMVALHAGAVRELCRRGIRTVHFPFGYIPDWDLWRRAPDSRDVDVVYLGSYEPRRARLLASYAQTLWTRDAQLILARFEPKPRPEPSFLVGKEKYELLRSSKILLNLHREGANGLEWVRIAEAICNGALVVSEHSRDTAPLVPGEHFVSARAPELAMLADGLLEDNERRRQLRQAAYDLLRERLPIDRSAEVLLNASDDLARSSRVTVRESDRLATPSPAPAPVAQLTDAVAQELWPVRAALKELRVEMLSLRRELSRVGALVSAPVPADDPAVVLETDAYAAVQPAISVLVSLYNYEAEVVDALASIEACEHDSFEVLVLDDASTDGSVAVVREFLGQRPWLPARLMLNPTNRGVSQTRNSLAAAARGELILVLDADNLVFPPALRKLERALKADPAATLSYPMCAIWEHGVPQGLLSVHDWNPRLLVRENYIDALALIRRSRFLELGGYSEDPRLTGQEDYDLWCRVADAGQTAVQVPEILGVYRRKAHGLLASVAQIDASVSRSLIRARAPRLFSEWEADPVSQLEPRVRAHAV